MKFIDEEDKRILQAIGILISQAKTIREQIDGYFVKDGKGEYESTQEILDVIRMHIRGESPDSIGEAVFQSDGEPVKNLLLVFGLKVEEEYRRIVRNG